MGVVIIKSELLVFFLVLILSLFLPAVNYLGINRMKSIIFLFTFDLKYL